MMGPENYGRYALLLSLSLYFIMLRDPGINQIMGRFIPRLRFQGEHEMLRKLFGNLLALSLASGTFAASLYLLLTSLWLTDLDLLLPATMAGTVVLRACSHPFFSLFLGLNQAARWGMNDIIHRWSSLVFLLIGFYLAGLHGACLGLFVAELIVLFVGAWWGRSYISWSEIRLDIRFLMPYLRFGLFFYVSHLMIAASNHSGAALVRFFYGDYVQVSYFSLAFSGFLTAAVAIPHLTLAFASFMTTLLGQGRTEELRDWTEHLIKWLAAAGVLVVFGVLLLGNDLIPLILGPIYRPVSINLLPLSLALFPIVLSSVTSLLSLIYNRPKVTLFSSGIRLAAFWGFGIPLIAWWGSFGACLAVLTAASLSAGYSTWRMQTSLPYSLQRWLWAIGLGGLFIPLAWLRSTLAVNLVLYGLFILGYLASLFLLRVITKGEVKGIWQAIHSKHKIPDTGFQESQQ
jgi:O-antigen/teichoic acid export membrane protein